MKVLVTGAGGTLGSAFRKLLTERGDEVFAYSHKELPIEDAVAFAKALEEVSPGLVVNTAAYNAVDKAETDQKQAFLINSQAVLNMALETKIRDIPFVHYSTDYVFDGEKSEAYVERDEPNPLSVYGRSKLLGEQACLAAHPESYVFRTAVVFGGQGNNFVTRLLKTAETQKDIRMVSDLIGSPAPAASLAEATLAVIEKNGPSGLYHAAGLESCSRYDMASAINEIWDLGLNIQPVQMTPQPGSAARPKKVVVQNARLAELGLKIDSWRTGLEKIYKESHHA